MEKSHIHRLLEKELLHKWRDGIEQAEKDTWFFTNVQETFEQLEKELSEKEKGLLKSYSLAIENKLEYINYHLEIKLLNFGIKVGMELEKSFKDSESQ